MMKRCLALFCLALALCAGALADARYAVSAGGVAALVDADGREWLSGGGIEAIFEVRPDALYAAGSPGDYALYDVDGEAIGETRFQMIDDMGGALVFRRDGLYGAMDDLGAVVLEPTWAQLVSDGAGGFLALQSSPLDEQPDELLRIGPDGTLYAAGTLVESGLSPLREGRMAFRAADGRYGCLDAAGAAVIPAEWAWIGDFEGGVAPVSDGALYGLIDLDGALVVSPKYVWLQRGDGLIAGLTEDGAAELLSADGRATLCTVPARSGDVALVGRWVVVRGKNVAALCDAQGVPRLEAGPRAQFFPGLDGQAIAVDGAWGEACQWLVNPDGSAASGKAQRILPLTGGRYAFFTFSGDYGDALCGLMDSAGVRLLPPAYREILPCGSDRLVLVTDDAVIFADLDGNRLNEWTIEKH